MIEHTIDRWTFLLHTELFTEYKELQKEARGDNYHTRDVSHRERFLVMAYDGIPRVSMSYVNGGMYHPAVCRISDFYTSKWVRGESVVRSIDEGQAERTKQLRYGMKLGTNDIIDQFTDYKLVLISKRADQRMWKRWMASMNFLSDEDTYYVLKSPRHAASSWRRVFYSGDMSLLDVDRMSVDKYEMMFNG